MRRSHEANYSAFNKLVCMYVTSCGNNPDDKNDDTKSPPSKKPFIFFDTSILWEYLEYEIDVPSLPFAFDLERAIDDWMLLFFFVGSDFLPHLPLLEIREGAIDTLLKICKAKLHRNQ